MLGIFAMMPPSPLPEKAIAALIGYALSLLLLYRRFRLSNAVVFGVGPILMIAITVLYHVVIQGRYGSGDLGYSFLIGIASASLIGCISRSRSDSERQSMTSLGWIYASLCATFLVTLGYYAVWFATAWQSDRDYDAAHMFGRFLVLGLFSGFSVAFALAVVHFLRRIKK